MARYGREQRGRAVDLYVRYERLFMFNGFKTG